MTFKVGVTRDLMTKDGVPCFREGAFEELARNSDITWEWLPENVDVLTPEHFAAFDALHINLPRVTADSAGDAPRVKIVARNGVGFDTVDLDAMTAAGIVVTNTPIAVRRPVAVATLSLVFALAGKLFQKDRMVRAGRWNDRVDYMGLGLTERTLGLIGAGSIGQEIAKLAAPFFGRVIANDPYVDDETLKDVGAEKRAFDELLAEADFVVACCLLTDETRHLVGADAFKRMQPEAYFVNVGRGPIHDEGALIAALQSGEIAGAGLDVTEVEPIPGDSPLLTMDNTIITAHALCWTDECFEDIARTALRSIVDVSLGVRPVHVVNAEAAAGLKPRD
ncbi:MAG: NAD(P)-dependent oxidoreductase [Pseudomonadota bacterium]